jgi:hypothetical protein
MSDLLLFLLLGGGGTGATAWFFRVISRKDVLLGDSRTALVRAEAEAEASREAAEAAEAVRAQTLGLAHEMQGQLGEALDLTRDGIGAVHQGVAGVDAKLDGVAAALAEFREAGAAPGGLEELGAKVEEILGLVGEQAQGRNVAAQVEELLNISRSVQQLREEFRAPGRLLSAEDVSAVRALLAEVAGQERGGRSRGRHEHPGAQLYVLPGTGSGEEERRA